MMSQPTDHAKVLVVEDEQIVAMDVRSQLCGLGYEVVGIATTGKEALRFCEERHPDLVLMDIQLQGPRDGIATASEVRRRWQIPVVFMTAFAGEETLSRAKLSAPYGYLTKPFQARHLSATISIALQQHRLTREMFREHGWLRMLLTSMSDGVIATDVQGRVTFVNPAAEDLIGWTLPEAAGRPIEEVYRLSREDGTLLDNASYGACSQPTNPLEGSDFFYKPEPMRPSLLMTLPPPSGTARDRSPAPSPSLPM